MACLPRTRSARYGFSLETKEEHSLYNNANAFNYSMNLALACSMRRKRKPLEKFSSTRIPTKREKKKKERDVDGCSVGGAWRKERMHEASMLYLLADVGQGRTAGFQLYRYLSGDNDRMAIAGVAVQRASEVGWIHSGYPLRSIIHPFEVRIPTCNRVQQLHARVHTVERREMLNRAQHSESNEPGRENRIGS